MTSPLANALAQTVKLNAAGVPFYLTAKPAPAAAKADDWGVLWSYNSAVKFAAPNDPIHNSGLALALSNYTCPDANNQACLSSVTTESV